MAGVFDGLSFGWRTALLALAIGQMLLLAVALTAELRNRVANRTLAALLVVLAGICTPWMIGFAGFYDQWRWLTFLPVQITLAVAPLVWFYAHALVTGHWPPRGPRHLAPAALQWVFLAASFLLPLPLKNRWADAVYASFDTVTSAATLTGLAGYGWASLALLRRYRRLLADARADEHRYAARWLTAVLVASMVLLPFWAGFVLWDSLVAPLGYTGLMGLYLGIAGFALFLGVEGWRHAALAFPAMAALTPSPAPPAPRRDWQAQGRLWAEQVRAAGWDSDPDIDLRRLARLLGTNTGYLSRAINEGLEVNFATFINRLRSERVAAMIAAGRRDDLLDLALEAGFSSKASFNRAFRGTTGLAPSDYRRLHGAGGAKSKKSPR